MPENFAKYFPLGLAKKQAFCNRLIEQEILAKNIRSIVHTVISSPRRYGKSSLALKVIEDSKLAYEVVDLFIAKDDETIERHILAGINRLIGKVITVSERAINLIKTTLKHINAKILIGTGGINLEFDLSKADVATNILEMLQALDKILIKQKIKAILFIDEFQQIGALDNSRGIEGAFRHVAQQTRNIIFIFSGSNRHLLMHMFDDRNRPFYKLCHHIHLERIEEVHYKKFLNKLSQKAWQKNLSIDEFAAIITHTERHPYYMNLLCSRIWQLKVKSNVQVINDIWLNYIFEERSKIIAELDKLTANQYFVLNIIAHGHNSDLTSKDFLTKWKISSSSVIKALKFLEQNDYIYKRDHQYYVIDPLIKKSLLVFSEN